MARESLPPGFRFHPTDDELVMYYLKRKIMGKPLRFKIIGELDLYKYDPWDLKEKACLRSRDVEWYFFCPRVRKYSNGSRTNRATENGYWKTTGRDRAVCNNSQTVGMKTTLVFHLGRAPHGDRTNWVMHEYKLEDNDLVDRGISKDAYVLCKIFEKSGAGPKNGAQYGAPFREEDWEEDVVNDSLEYFPLANPGSPSLDPADDQNTVAEKSMLILENSHTGSLGHNGTDDSELELAILENNVEALPCLDGNDIFNGLGDLSTMAELKRSNDFQLHNLGNKYVLEDCMELDDLEHPMQCPTKDNFSERIPYEDHSISSELNPNDKFHLLSPGYKYDLDQTLPADGVSFMELIDLDYPMKGPVEADAVLPSYGVSDYHSMLPIGPGLSDDHLAMVSNDNQFGGSASCEDDNAMQNHVVVSDGESEREQAYTSRVLARGEQHKASYSRLECLLGSIPARPASAAEYPPLTDEGKGSKGSSLSSYYGGSSIHVKAEVTVRCRCTEDALSVKLGEVVPCLCYGHNLSREIGKKAATYSSGFTFMFLLGVITALVWVFLLAMGAKLGWHAWKLIIS